MNAKHFAAYEVMKGFNCGGESIGSWTDGSNAAYGEITGISECEQTCNMHEECAGFVRQSTTNICGFWRRGPLNPYSKVNHNCHKKIQGITMNGEFFRFK